MEKENNKTDGKRWGMCIRWESVRWDQIVDSNCIQIVF